MKWGAASLQYVAADLVFCGLIGEFGGALVHAP
jgi:hypothetical protein